MPAAPEIPDHTPAPPARRSHVLAFLDSWPGRLTAAGALLASVLVSPAAVLEGPVLCPVRRFVGMQCPGCGLTRAFVYLSHGDLTRSIAQHPFGILVYLVFVATVVWAIARTRMRPVRGLVVLWRRLSPVVVACWALWWATQRLLPAIS